MAAANRWLTQERKKQKRNVRRWRRRPGLLMRLARVKDVQEAATLLADETQPRSRSALAAQLVVLHADEDAKGRLSAAIQDHFEAFQILMQEHAAHEAAVKMQEHGWTDIRQVRADLRDQGVASERRTSAAMVLGDLDDRRSVGDLIGALAEGDRNLAWACSSALNAIKSRRHGRSLVGVLRKRTTGKEQQFHARWHR